MKKYMPHLYLLLSVLFFIMTLVWWTEYMINGPGLAIGVRPKPHLIWPYIFILLIGSGANLGFAIAHFVTRDV